MGGSLLLISGPPGAGKSTVAALLAASFDPSVLVRGDDFFGFLSTGSIDPWLPASAAQNKVVTEAAAAATSRFVTAGYDTVYDGVVGPWLIDWFLDVAQLQAINYAVLLPSLDRCLDRVRTRTGHGFTDAGATDKMHHEFSVATIDERHVFANDDDSPEETASNILSLAAAGELRYAAP